MISLVISLVELGKHLSHRLNELPWWEGLSLAVKVMEEVASGCSYQNMRIIFEAG